MSASAAIEVEGLQHRYGEHRALKGIDFAVAPAEIFGLLGPNGGGKTTLFRVLTTLLPVQDGSARVMGHNVASTADVVRRCIGVTFQSPSLDGRLTVLENLKHQGHLYGIWGRQLQKRAEKLIDQFSLSDRAGDRVESLSGGLKRRVEIAKGLLHEPRVLLLDEPSTGLDPGARHDLWRCLQQLQGELGVTVLLTTHIMDEAEKCDRLAILDRGELVASGTPEELRTSVGGACLSIRSSDPDVLSTHIAERFGIRPDRLGEMLRIEHSDGHEFLRDLVAAFPEEIETISLGKPTLEDVFIARTGHRFWEGESR